MGGIGNFYRMELNSTQIFQYIATLTVDVVPVRRKETHPARIP